MVLQEGRVAAGNGWRQQNANRFGYRAAVVQQQLHRLVQRSGVGAVLRQDGLALSGQRGVARLHACAITPYGVYLAVVRQRAAGLRAVPRGRGVGGIPLVKQSERRDEAIVLQVWIEFRQQAADAHGLVDHRLRRQRCDVPGNFAGLQPALECLTRKVQLALELLRRAGQQHVTDLWHGAQRNFAQHLGLDGHVPPLQHGDALLCQAGIEDLAGVRVLLPDKDDTNPKRLRIFKDNARLCQQQSARHGAHDSDTVGALAVGRNRATMCQAGKRRKRVRKHLVRCDVAGVRDKADAAGVMIEAGIHKGAHRLPGAHTLGSGWRKTRVHSSFYCAETAWARAAEGLSVRVPNCSRTSLQDDGRNVLDVNLCIFIQLHV